MFLIQCRLHRVLPDAEKAIPPLPTASNKHQLKELLKLQKKLREQQES